MNTNAEEIEIKSLSEYILEIQNINKNYESEEYNIDLNNQIFYRGQANKEWNISASIFRNNLLKYESNIILDAYGLNFNEVLKYKNPFERLTVLQHYGLPTRLLDVTLNPFVALYFACEEFIEYKEYEDNSGKFERLENDGIIYFKKSEFENYNSKNVKIISKIAELEFKKGYKIENLLEDLLNEKIINDIEYNKFKNTNKDEFIKILRNAYFVNSNKSNKRLINQSGVFLLASSINIQKEESNFIDKLISKANIELRHMFDNVSFIIPYKFKAKILEELSMYNINKGSLFPELESQMEYLKETCLNRLKNTSTSVPEFDLMLKDEDILKTIKDINIPDKNINEETFENISKNDDKSINNLILNLLITNNMKNSDIILKEIHKILDNYTKKPDWDTKESIKSKIIIEISRFIRKQTKCEIEIGKILASKIYDMLINNYNY